MEKTPFRLQLALVRKLQRAIRTRSCPAHVSVCERRRAGAGGMRDITGCTTSRVPARMLTAEHTQNKCINGILK